MADSLLSVTNPDLRAEVADFLGLGRRWDAETIGLTAYPGLTDDQKTRVDAYIKSGQRMFYGAHDWNFLKPVVSLTTIAGTGDYELPAEYASIIGTLTYADSTSSLTAIPVCSEGDIRVARQMNQEQTGRPLKAAVRPKDHDGTRGQRYELLFWPIPDAAYELEYRMAVNAQALSPTAPFPWGGFQHGETLLEACLAIAEARMEEGGNGIHAAMFQQRLRESVEKDSRFSRPDYLGYNGDASDNRGAGVYRMRGTQSVTYNGVEY